MAKVADRYLVVDPWAIIEKGFHADRSLVSESTFSSDYLFHTTLDVRSTTSGLATKGGTSPRSTYRMFSAA